ncbi:hypothetical protein [Bacillus pinisoli]|uniref:hypothetical protein n=1 Tax=Bacillus pinisoli TaxID=2901866 RepID=UPI001FF2F53E|nr:hypothetical protein [Bacillus pinisoli]
MFDPTIFDNLKVVIEGAVYDKDLEGELAVINRRDIVDLATMSRQYLITFKLPGQSNTHCSWELSSSVRQLSSELLLAHKELTGCSTKLTFTIEHHKITQKLQHVQSLISEIWEDREMKIKVISTYPETEETIVEITLLFNRTIHEEDIDDLLHMFSYMEETLLLLQENGY